MRIETRLAVLCACAAAAAVGGCAASHAPHGWLPYAQEAQLEGYGGWIEVEARDTTGRPRLSGELLAVSDDSVLVLSQAGVGGRALADVGHAALEVYNSRSGDTARMTLAGTLTSISTGVGLILVAPLWIVVGSISTATLSSEGRMAVDASRPSATSDSGGVGRSAGAGRLAWKDVRLYARFPQGLPAGLDRASLRARPLPNRKRTGTRPGTIVSE